MAEENPHLYDIRVVQRYIDKGDVDARDFSDHLKSLPDLADQLEKLDIAPPGAGMGPRGHVSSATASASEADNAEG
jgi:hypothetical protein